MLKKWSPKNFLDSCSPLPSPKLKWQVIAPLQLGRKEQEGPCDFEGGAPLRHKSQTWGEMV